MPNKNYPTSSTSPTRNDKKTISKISAGSAKVLSTITYSGKLFNIK